MCCEEAISRSDNVSLTGPFAAQGCSYMGKTAFAEAKKTPHLRGFFTSQVGVEERG